MRVALKIAYDGRPFHGFARQPDLRTVEGEVIHVLAKAGLVRDLGSANLRGASRTDAGVSALGNVIAFDADAGVRGVVGRFNDASRDVWAWALAEAPEGFDPRHARERWYRYHLMGERDPGLLREAAGAFLGTHDFTGFAHSEAKGQRRTIDSIEVLEAPDGVLIDVRAPSFLRGMVRRIVAALLAVESGDATRADLDRALEEGGGPDLGAMPPEGLTLMDVDVGLLFRAETDRATRERAGRRADELRASTRFWRELETRMGRGALPP